MHFVSIQACCRCCYCQPCKEPASHLEPAYLGLLLNGEVGPGELGVDVLLVQLQDLVVGDGAGVGVVLRCGKQGTAQQGETWPAQPSSGLCVPLSPCLAGTESFCQGMQNARLEAQRTAGSP